MVPLTGLVVVLANESGAVAVTVYEPAGAKLVAYPLVFVYWTSLPGVTRIGTECSALSVPASKVPFPFTSLKANDVTHPPARALSANERLVAGPTVITKLSGLDALAYPGGGR